MLNIALPKGRLGEKAYSMLENAGYQCNDINSGSRRLIFENTGAGVRFFQVKPADVPVYVERGAADIGIAGKDVLLESSPDVYELLDLRIGKCRMAVAAPSGFSDDTGRTLRVATKFPNIAHAYYAGENRRIDIIKLHGSIELAPLIGMSDVILDIVETGKTLAENDLHVLTEIYDISARLIANKTSYKFKSVSIDALCEKLKGEISDD